MMYYVVRLEWSLTDRETKIVKANSEEDAKAYFTYENGPRYVSVTGSSDQIVDLTDDRTTLSPDQLMGKVINIGDYKVTEN